jgi:hypothetical protein
MWISRVGLVKVCYLVVQVTPTNVDIASVAPKYHLYTKEEIEEVISRL